MSATTPLLSTFHYRGDPGWMVPHPQHGPGDGLTYGACLIPARAIGNQAALSVIFSGASPGCSEWDHVSVSTTWRCPTWDEMCAVRALFWDEEACVVQYHPPRSDYVNRHPHVLHLWRWASGDFPMPPKEFV